ncbi:hypothetical protein [Morganella morganii]|uniref:hypothetical protein n=1 Tax=Morganella morganii TaxID=582 RepID=UPI0021CEE494|nr:hypothetical protein [Morganella morganii]MCU6351136.1 hypothetical protein [Morganella morganii]
MNWKEAVIAGLFIVAAWWVYDTYWDNQQLKVNNTRLSGQLSAQRTINTITLSAVSIRHRVAIDNIKAKETEGTENVKVKTGIRTEFKDSECAVTPVSPGVVGRLQQYERNIRTRAGGSDSGSTDR